MYLTRLSFLLCAVTFFTICHSFKVGRPEFDTLIVGGTPATRGEFPWLVSIQVNGIGHYCGGTILNSEWILTAAHCMFEESGPQGYQIVAGEYLGNETDPSEQVVEVKAFFVHENFGETFQNDIGLIQLKSYIKFDDLVKPGNITASTAANQLVVAGWGYTEYDTPPASVQLLKVTVPLRPDADCDVYADYGYTGIKQICAGIGGKDSCSGDSGGALINEGDKTVVGIVSYGGQCGLQAYPGVYTRIGYYHDWIIKKMADQTNSGNTVALYTKFVVFLASIFHLLKNIGHV